MMSEKTQNINNDFKNFVVKAKTVYKLLLFIMASFLFTTFIQAYLFSIFPSFFTDIGMIILGFVLFIIGGILMNKFKE